MSQAFTKEEVWANFLDEVRASVSYWEHEKRNPDSIDKLNGLAFSILILIDGCASMPAMNLAVMPHEDDKQYHLENGDNWYEPGMVFNDDVKLHEMWHKQESPS